MPQIAALAVRFLPWALGIGAAAYVSGKAAEGVGEGIGESIKYAVVGAGLVVVARGMKWI